MAGPKNPRKPWVLAGLALFNLVLWFVLFGTLPKPAARLAGDPTQAQRAPQTVASLPVQLRGLWVDAFGPGIKTPKETDALLENAKRMGVNALFVQVGRRMDCYCNLASVPRSQDPAFAPNFDALAYLIQKAKPLGLQVHAWIITTGAWNAVEPYGANDHVWRVHGPSATGRDNWVNYRVDGMIQSGPDFFLDPAHPEAADYIVEMYKSVVANYDVDGIMLDRVRYPDSGVNNFVPNWGYNPTSLERFKQEQARGDTPKPDDAAWVQWRRDQVTALVRRIYLEVKTIKPSVWVSAATITYKEGPRNREDFATRRTFKEVLQDWPAWLEENILDLVVTMNYKREQRPEDKLAFDQWNVFAGKIATQGRVAVGSAMYINSANDALGQAQRALVAPNSTGWVGYSYRNPELEVFEGKKSNAEGQRQMVQRFAALFKSPSVWDKPAHTNITGVLGRVVQGGLPVGGVSLELLGPENRKVVSDANGFFGASWLLAGRYEVLHVGSGVSSSIEVKEGGIVGETVLELP